MIIPFDVKPINISLGATKHHKIQQQQTPPLSKKTNTKASIPFLTSIIVNVWCLSEFTVYREPIAKKCQALTRILCLPQRTIELTLAIAGIFYNCSASASLRKHLQQIVQLGEYITINDKKEQFSILKASTLIISSKKESIQVILLFLAMIRNLVSGRRAQEAKAKLRFIVPQLLKMIPDAEKLEKLKDEENDNDGSDDDDESSSEEDEDDENNVDENGERMIGGKKKKKMSYKQQVAIGQAVLILVKELSPIDNDRIRRMRKNVITSRAQRPAGLMSDETLAHLHKLKVMDKGNLFLAQLMKSKVHTRKESKRRARLAILNNEDDSDDDDNNEIGNDGDNENPTKEQKRQRKKKKNDMVEWVELEYQKMLVETRDRSQIQQEKQAHLMRTNSNYYATQQKDNQNSSQKNNNIATVGQHTNDWTRRSGDNNEMDPNKNNGMSTATKLAMESPYYSLILSNTKTTDDMLKKSGRYTSIVPR